MKNIYNLTRYLINLVGIFVILYYIWFRFIRQRLPKDIPFNLSLFSFITLIIIIVTFSFLLKKTIKPTNSQIYNQIYPIMAKIYNPLLVMNQFFINTNFIKKIVIEISKKLTFISFGPFKKYYYLYMITNIVFKYVLLLIFYIDIFYFHKLYYTYIFLTISIIPLICSYFIYIMPYILEEYTKYLETLYQIQLLATHTDPEQDCADLYSGDGMDSKDFQIRTFLLHQKCALIGHIFKYKCSITWDAVHKYYPTLGGSLDNIDLKQRQVIEKEFYDLIPSIINMSQILFKLHVFSIKSKMHIQKIHIIYYVFYIIGWTYVLLVSIYTFNFTDLDLQFLKVFQETYEPFSNTLLW